MWTPDPSLIVTAEAAASERLAALWAALRAERDRRLAASDWALLTDAPLNGVQKAAWKAYRKALRDLPDTADPMKPEWPEMPA